MSRMGGEWYDGAKPSDSPAMRDAFSVAEMIVRCIAATPQPADGCSSNEGAA